MKKIIINVISISVVVGSIGASLYGIHDELTSHGRGQLAAVAPISESLIPSERTVEWEAGVTVGVIGGIPDDRTQCLTAECLAVVNASSDYKDGTTDATTLIQAAIDSALPSTYVFIPAGTWKVQGMNLGHNRDNITVRGAGMDETIFSCTENHSCVYMGSGSNWNWGGTWIDVTSGATKGSNQLTLTDASELFVGQLINIGMDDDITLPIIHVSSWRGSVRNQKAIITAKNGNTITISPAIAGDYSAFNPKVQGAGFQGDGIGIEHFTLDFVTPSSFGIFAEQIVNSWIKDVKVKDVGNYIVYINNSAHCEMRHNYLDELDHDGPNGSGLIFGASSGCLIEDNIVVKAFPLFEINSGSTANVFAYNFLGDSNSYDIIGSALNTNHGPHNSYNLYEGNIAPNVQADGYFGSVSHDTFFRNWFHGTIPSSDATREPVLLNRFTRYYSFVGNLIGKTGVDHNVIWGGYAPSLYSLGMPNIGNSGYNGDTAQLSQGDYWESWTEWQNGSNGSGPGPNGFQELDLDVASTTIIKLNWNSRDQGIAANEQVDATLPNSLYRGSKPCWFGSMTWPAFDPNNPVESFSRIPAGYRFVNGSETPGLSDSCDDAADPDAPEVDAPEAVPESAPDNNSNNNSNNNSDSDNQSRRRSSGGGGGGGGKKKVVAKAPVVATTTYAFTRDLTIGSSGPDVTALQDILMSKGYLTIPAGQSKGYFGTLTQGALLRYQIASGITPATGYFGPKTRAMIQGGSTPVITSTVTTVVPTNVPTGRFTRDLTIGSEGSDVRALQLILIEKGYLIDGSASGYFGPLTQQGLVSYQRELGISPATGYFGAKSRQYIK